MGILKNGHGVDAIYYKGRPIIAVYALGQLIWPDRIINEILSCFYNGYWMDEYPWTEDTPWTD